MLYYAIIYKNIYKKIQESARVLQQDGFENVELQPYVEHIYDHPNDMYLEPNSFYQQPDQ